MHSLPPAPTTPHDPEDPASQAAAHVVPRSHGSRTRFVTLCQQLLVLGVILAVLTPATGIVSIDFAPAPQRQAAPAPGTSGTVGTGTLPAMSMAAYSAAQSVPVVVPTAVVDPTIREVSLTAKPGQRMLPGALATAKSKVNASGVQRIISTPQKVTGYGAVGLTWQHGDLVPDDQIKVKVRLLDDGRWSGWTKMTYHDDHGPDPDSAEGKRARPGTDEMLVGDVDQVQVKVVTDQAAPPDMKLAVIDPGVATSSAKELPAIDTAVLDEEAGRAEPAVADTGDLTTSDGDVALAAGVVTPKPKIYSRAQWGADEKMRDKSSLHYYEVHAGFVHHTVNANNYKAEDVPAILRGIYAYHTRSRGWSDVGYNYLVDRFGRIWEGRAGGVDRAVVGAHTLGYNDDSFAMSAIGNYEETRPSQAMIEAYGALFAWKLSLHGVSASSTRQYVTSRYFQAINGHRDAASTACPGKYLYARIPQIRRLAAQAQASFAGRELESNITGEPTPDIVVRRGSDGRGFTIAFRKRASDGRIVKGKITDTGLDLSTQNRLLNAGDWDRDGKSDIITRRASNGALYYRPGLGNGKFGEAVLIGTGFNNVKMLTAVGDMTGDGWPDLIGAPDGGAMRIYPGKGKNGLKASYVAYSKVTARQVVGTGLWDGDGAPDVIARTATKLVLYPGNGPGGLTGAKTLDFDASPYNLIVGVSDLDGDGHADLLARKRNGQLFLLPGTTTGVGTPVLIGAGYNTFNQFS